MTRQRSCLSDNTLQGLVLHFQIPSAALKSSWTWTQQVQTIHQRLMPIRGLQGRQDVDNSPAYQTCSSKPSLALSNSQRSTKIKLGLDSTSADHPSAGLCLLFEGSRVGRTSTTALPIRHAPQSLLLHSQIPSAALKSSWAWTQQVQTIHQRLMPIRGLQGRQDVDNSPAYQTCSSKPSSCTFKFPAQH